MTESVNGQDAGYKMSNDRYSEGMKSGGERNPKKRLGARGEELAARHLESRGYTILARNHRSRLGEIDLVARDAKTLVFVEVKTRSSDAAGLPLEAITPEKARRLRRLALAFTTAHPELQDLDPRIDCIGVLLGKETVIDHVEAAV